MITFFRSGSLLIQSYFAVWAFLRLCGVSTRSLLGAVLFLLCLVFFRETRRKMQESPISHKFKTTCVILSLIFTFFMLFGACQRLTGELANGMFRLLISFACAAGLLFLFYHVLVFLFLPLSEPSFTDKIFGTFPDRRTRFLPLILFGACLLSWLPYFLYEFPGVMTPDSMNQLEQALGLVPYSNHHPWVHTLIIKLFYSLGRLFTEDVTTAVAFYTVFQMCFLSFCAAYLIATLRRFHVKARLLILIGAFYALVPYQGVFAVTIWKDVLFAGSVLLFGTVLLRLLYFGLHVQEGVLYWFSGMLVCLTRSNGWYAYLLTLPFLLILFLRKRVASESEGGSFVRIPRCCGRAALPLLILSVPVAALLVKGPVMTAYGVRQPDFVESISIPLQQTARVICAGRELTKEQWEMVHRVFDTTYIKELYAPGFADNMKELVRAGDPDYLTRHKGDYLKLWLTLGLKYPDEYFKAYRDQTLGYWYPDVTFPIAEADGVIDNTAGVRSRPLIGGPAVVKGKEILLKLESMLPLYGILWSMGAMFWFLLLFTGLIVIRGEYRKLAVLLPGFAVIVTLLIATPVSTEFRYAYSLAYSLPLYLLTALLRPKAGKLTDGEGAQDTPAIRAPWTGIPEDGDSEDC